MKYLIFFLLSYLYILNASTLQLVSTTNCPYTCGEEEQDKGFVIDIVKHVFNEAGYKVVYTSVNTEEESLNGVRTGKYDLMVGADPIKNPELVFMKKPLGYTYNIIAVPTYSKWKYDSVKSLSALKLAAIKEVTYTKEISQYLHKYKYKHNNPKVQMKSGHLARAQNLKKLRFDKVTAIIDDRISLRYFYFKKKKKFAFKIAHTSKSKAINIAFSPKSYRANKYKKILYKALKKLKGSQELKEIMKKYGLSEAYIRPIVGIP